MSLQSMIFKANTHCHIMREVVTRGAGAQLTKTWAIRWPNVPARWMELKAEKKALLYDREKIMADAEVLTPYRTGLVTADRLRLGGVDYMIQKITDWDIQHKYLSILVQKVD